MLSLSAADLMAVLLAGHPAGAVDERDRRRAMIG
jgi:hypothetical protein